VVPLEVVTVLAVVIVLKNFMLGSLFLSNQLKF
jgi:hypothetical protein